MKTLKKTYFVLDKVSNIICRILEAIIVLLVVVNAADVFLQVFNRYVLVKISDISVSWTEELARYSMIWICYLMLGICFLKQCQRMLPRRLDGSGRYNIQQSWP